MFIEKIYIERFSGLQDLNYNFASGINLVEGNNESGKTAICMFIKFILYGFANKSERMMYIPWGSENASGTLSLNDSESGISYRIERSCTLSGVDNCKIIDLSANTVCFKDSIPGEVFYHIPLQLFEKTAFVRQSDNGKIDGRGIDESIENLLFSADETVNTQKALKKLDDARIMLLYKNRKGGKILEYQSEIESLESRMIKATESNSGVISREGSINEINEKLTAYSEKAESLKTLIDKYETGMVLRRFNNLNDVKKRMQIIEIQLKDIEKKHMKNGFLPDEDYLSQLKSFDYEFKKLDSEVKTTALELDRIKKSVPHLSDIYEQSQRFGGKNKIADTITEAKLKKRSHLTFCIIFTVLFTLSSIGAIIVSMLNEKIGFLFSAVCVALLFGTFINFVFMTRNSKIIKDILHRFSSDSVSELMRRLDTADKDYEKIKSVQYELDSVQRNYANLIHQINIKKIEIDSALSEWDATSLESAISGVENYIKIHREKLLEFNKIQAVYDNLSAQYQNNGEFNINEAVNAADSIDSELDSIDIKSVKREYEFITKASEGLMVRIRDYEKQLAAMKAVCESPSYIMDKIHVISGKIDELNFNCAAYILAYEKLTQAAAALQSNVSPRLSEFAGKLMGAITADKYTNLGVSGGLKFVYTFNNRTHDSDYMSAGTLDAAYISLRYALLDLLCGEKTPPIMFDESFSRLDDVRLSNMFNLISTMSEKGLQSIICTSQKRDAVLIKNAGIYNYIKI